MESLKKLPSNEQAAGVIAAVLRLADFFPEFTAEHLDKLFPRSGLYEYPQGATLMQQGDVARDLFIICKGKVAIRQSFGSAAAELAVVGDGAILGEIALLRAGDRTATGVVSETSQIFRLAYEDVQYILKNNPELAAHLKALAAERAGR